MTILAVIVLLGLLALREISNARIRSTSANATAVRRWRTARRWQSLAILFAVVAYLPILLGDPRTPLLREVDAALTYLWPLPALLATACLYIAGRSVLPEMRRAVRRRQAAIERQQRAARGQNPERLSRSLREWILENGPGFDYRFDVATTEGVANIVIATEHNDYALYVLPAEHADDGFPTALKRSTQIANELNAISVVWVPEETRRSPQIQQEDRRVVARGSIIDLLQWIEKITDTERKRRERIEQRRRQARKFAQGSDVRWGSMSEDEALATHDRESWDRFARKTPIHPEMRRRVFSRQGGRCALCGITMESGRDNWQVIVTDYDHVCRNLGKIRFVPHGVRGATTYEMPDCVQCQIDTPEHFDACLKRLAAVHTLCESERQATKRKEAVAAASNRASTTTPRADR